MALNTSERPLELQLCGETLTLLAERAVFWPRRRTLLVADVHLGKAATFQHFGLAVPDGAEAGTTQDDLRRLSHLIEKNEAARLVILGDLLHNRHGQADHILDLVRDWRARHLDLEITLVRGNHDRRAGDPPADWHITCVEQPWPDAPFCFRHEPATEIDAPSSSCGYTLAGHIHPAVTLSGRGKLRERLPCFTFGPTSGLLPAFGSFTGGAAVRPKTGDRVFVIASDVVMPIVPK